MTNDNLTHEQFVDSMIDQVAHQKIGGVVKHFALESLINAGYDDLMMDKVVAKLDQEDSAYRTTRNHAETQGLPQNAYANALLNDIESVITIFNGSNVAKYEKFKTSFENYLASDEFKELICVDANS